MTSLVPMPEAPVHEHDGAVAREHNVRTADKTAVVESKAKAAPVQKCSDRLLRGSVFSSDPAHESGPPSSRHRVRHVVMRLGRGENLVIAKFLDRGIDLGFDRSSL